MTITITEIAAQELKKIAQNMAEAGQGLRLFVEGGCCGQSYGMGFDHQQDGDFVCEQHGLTVLIDPQSQAQLSGVTIDCIQTPDGPAFEVKGGAREENSSSGCCRSENSSNQAQEQSGCCRQ